MPELPEVETVARGLRRYCGQKILDLDIFDAKVWFESESAPKGVKNQTLRAVNRRGKYLIFDLGEGASIVAHLRMTGKFLPENSEALPAWVKKEIGKKQGKALQIRCRFTFTNENLLFYDTRRFGTLSFVKNTNNFFTRKKIAPDIMEQFVSARDHFLARISKIQKPIKAALLDQQLIAGAGNIYADEALFLAGVDPRKPARKVKDPARLFALLRDVMQSSLELGGTTVYNYVNSSGENGRFAERLRVYGKEKCSVCHKVIHKITLGGRTSHYCRHCQK